VSVAEQAKGRAVGAKDEALSFWAHQRASRPWLDHVVRAWQQLGNTNGSLLAAALTFVSFLALIPLILLAVAVAGFVLRSHPDTLQKLLNQIQKQAPGGLGGTLKTAVKTAVDKRAGIGIVGLVGVALTGLGWVNNLRTATEQVWQHPPLKRSFVKAKIADLFVLAVLGAGLIVSVALTAVGSALTHEVVKVLSFSGSTATNVLARVVTIGVAVLADMFILGFLLFRLPRATVPRGTAIRAALLAAIGFEILKVVGTYYMAAATKNPAFALFGPILGVLLFLNLVFRFLLFCTAWTATGTPDDPLVEPQMGAEPAQAGPQPAPAGGQSARAGSPDSAPRNGAGARGPDVDRSQPGRSRGLALAVTLGALARRRRR
jgi:membrane protein